MLFQKVQQTDTHLVNMNNFALFYYWPFTKQLFSINIVPSFHSLFEPSSARFTITGLWPSKGMLLLPLVVLLHSLFVWDGLFVYSWFSGVHICFLPSMAIISLWKIIAVLCKCCVCYSVSSSWYPWADSKRQTGCLAPCKITDGYRFPKKFWYGHTCFSRESIQPSVRLYFD